MKRSLLAMATAAPLSIACGGTVLHDRSAGNGVLAGSYDIAFQNVTASNAPSSTTSPTLLTKARLDLFAQSDGSYSAVVTPRWGTPAPFSVAVTDSTVVLSGGSAGIQGADADDGWQSFTFDRAPDGNLGTSFATSGIETNQANTDEIWMSPVAAQGTVERDVTKPESTLNGTSNMGPPNALLPWDSITLTLAEPIANAVLLPALALDSTEGAVPITWTTQQGTAGSEWAGDFQALGTVPSWDGTLTQASLSLAALVDRAGNLSSPTTTPIRFLPLPLAPAPVTFDSGTVAVASWGALTFLGGLTGSDPSCENGACAQMGMFEASTCGVPRIGMAGRLAVPGATEVSVRYRVLVDGSGLPAGTQPSFDGVGPAFSLDVATPATQPVTGVPTIPSGALTVLTSPVLGMSWATSWSTLTVNVQPPGPPEGVIVFAVRAGASIGPTQCGGPGPARGTIVLIDSVTAE